MAEQGAAQRAPASPEALQSPEHLLTPDLEQKERRLQVLQVVAVLCENLSGSLFTDLAQVSRGCQPLCSVFFYLPPFPTQATQTLASGSAVFQLYDTICVFVPLQVVEFVAATLERSRASAAYDSWSTVEAETLSMAMGLVATVLGAVGQVSWAGLSLKHQASSPQTTTRFSPD